MGSMNSEQENTLNQILTCMDGLDTSNNGVIVMAATNRSFTLPSACVTVRCSSPSPSPLWVMSCPTVHRLLQLSCRYITLSYRIALLPQIRLLSSTSIYPPSPSPSSTLLSPSPAGSSCLTLLCCALVDLTASCSAPCPTERVAMQSSWCTRRSSS